MSARTLKFLLNEDGSTTVDWVILTGASAALAVIMMSTMNGDTTSIAQEIETTITDVEVVTIGSIGYSQ